MNAPICDGGIVIGPRARTRVLAPIGALCHHDAEQRVERQRVLDLERHAQLQVVLEVLADAGQLVHDRDAVLLQQRAGPDARELEDLRAADRAGGKDRLAPRLGERPRRRGRTRRRSTAGLRAAASSPCAPVIPSGSAASSRASGTPSPRSSARRSAGSPRSAPTPSLSPRLKSSIFGMPASPAASRNASRISHRSPGVDAPLAARAVLSSAPRQWSSDFMKTGSTFAHDQPESPVSCAHSS